MPASRLRLSDICQLRPLSPEHGQLGVDQPGGAYGLIEAWGLLVVDLLPAGAARHLQMRFGEGKTAHVRTMHAPSGDRSAPPKVGPKIGYAHDGTQRGQEDRDRRGGDRRRNGDSAILEPVSCARPCVSHAGWRPVQRLVAEAHAGSQ